MNKLLKTLLPIGSAAALAPTICLASCGFMSGTMTCDSETTDGNFTITFVFKEEVLTPEEKANYTFTCEEPVSCDAGTWDSDNKTVTFNAMISVPLSRGARYPFTFYVNYEHEGGTSTEKYPGRITYTGK